MIPYEHVNKGYSYVKFGRVSLALNFNFFIQDCFDKLYYWVNIKKHE